MQFGTNKVIYSPTFLNIYWGMVNHDKIIIHMQILWADSSSHNGCCFPTYHIILQQVVRWYDRNFLSNMSEHTVDIQCVTSDKSTSYLEYGFHNWIFWLIKEHFSTSCIFFLHPTGRNSQGEHDLDPKPPLYCGRRSRSPSFDCSSHRSPACGFSVEMNLIVVLFYF